MINHVNAFCKYYFAKTVNANSKNTPQFKENNPKT